MSLLSQDTQELGVILIFALIILGQTVKVLSTGKLFHERSQAAISRLYCLRIWTGVAGLETNEHAEGYAHAREKPRGT